MGLLTFILFKAFADALLVIPKALASNSGYERPSNYKRNTVNRKFRSALI